MQARQAFGDVADLFRVPAGLVSTGSLGAFRWPVPRTLAPALVGLWFGPRGVFMPWAWR
jgi:hypothetical protein